MLIRLNRLNDDCAVELRISIPVPPVDDGTIVIGNDVGSLIMLSIESGSSSMTPGRMKSFSLFSSRRIVTSSSDDVFGVFVDGKNVFTNFKLSEPVSELALDIFDPKVVAAEVVVGVFDVNIIEFDVVSITGNANACNSFRKSILTTFFLFDF